MEYTQDSIASLISHIHSQTADFTNKRLSDSGHFVSSQGFILYLLSKSEKLTKGEIALSINRDKSTVTHLLNILKKEKLISEKTCENDSRKHYIYLTEKGKQYNALTEKISSELRDICWANFSDEEKNELLSLLLKMKENLDNESFTPHVNQ